MNPLDKTYRGIVLPFDMIEDIEDGEDDRFLAWIDGVDDALKYAGVPENGAAFVISVDDPEQLVQTGSEVEYSSYNISGLPMHVNPDPAFGTYTFHIQVQGAHTYRFLKTGTKADDYRSPGDKALDVLHKAGFNSAAPESEAAAFTEAVVVLRNLVRKAEQS